MLAQVTWSCLGTYSWSQTRFERAWALPKFFPLSLKQTKSWWIQSLINKFIRGCWKSATCQRKFSGLVHIYCPHARPPGPAHEVACTHGVVCWQPVGADCRASLKLRKLLLWCTQVVQVVATLVNKNSFSSWRLTWLSKLEISVHMYLSPES